MPLQVWEKIGREFRFGEGRVEDTLQYFVTGAFTESEVVTAISLVIPSVFNGLFFLNTQAQEVGYGYWEGTVNYGIPTAGAGVPSQLGPPGTSPPPPPPPGATDALGPEWSFTTSGGTQHVTTSEATREKTKGFGFGTAPDFRQAIGVSKTGVEGADKVVPKFDFTVTKKYPAVSLTYLKTLIELTGRVNQSLFLGVFDDESILYLGADGNYRDNEGWSIVHRFSGALNRAAKNPSSTNPLDRIAPKGHDVVWCLYEDGESEGFKVSVPAAAYVEKVYLSGDFNKLGL